MAEIQEKDENVVSSVKFIARKFAYLCGVPPGQPVGPAFIVAALAKALGEGKVGELLGQHGVSDVKILLAAIPDCVQEEASEFPELRPNEDLRRLLKARLGEFFQGKMLAEEALKTLLEAGTADIKDLLSDPRTLMRGWSKSVATKGTRDLLKKLTLYYQPRFHAGYNYYTVDAGSGTSDFMTGKRDKEFLEVISESYREETYAHYTLFSSRLYLDSPLGNVVLKHGPLGAHIVGISVLAEMGLVYHGPISIHQIAWTLDPKNFHRMLGFTLEKVTELHKAGLVEVQLDDDCVRLYSVVIASHRILNEFLCYLRDADPLTEEDQSDILQRVF